MERLDKLDRETNAITVIPRFSHDFWISERREFTDRNYLQSGTNAERLRFRLVIGADIDIHGLDVDRLAALRFIQQVRRDGAYNPTTGPLSVMICRR